MIFATKTGLEKGEEKVGKGIQKLQKQERGSGNGNQRQQKQQKGSRIGNQRRHKQHKASESANYGKILGKCKENKAETRLGQGWKR